METIERTAITVETTVNAPLSKVWEYWTEPKHITAWCQASDDWCAPYADNDVKENGKFKTTMAAKDGSMKFDFEGIYTAVDPQRRLAYTIGDGRKVTVDFVEKGKQTLVTEKFETEDTHSPEMQRQGWQAILDNFKKYTENN